MDERDFELIAALAQTRNITRAAEQLFVTQSSLSKRIQAIESELGITLLLRSRLGVHFTPEGEEVYKRTTEATNQLKLMRSNLEAQKGYICGTLNAGISVNYSLYKLPGVLSTFRKHYPHVNTHITADHSRKLYLQVLNGAIDVAVLRGEYQWKENKILLEREKICAIVNLKDKGKSLNKIPFIGRKTDSGFEREIMQWMHQNNLQTKQHGIVVDSITTCVEMVNHGIGWTIVPEICLGDFYGDIRPLSFSNGEPFVRSTYLMYTDAALELPQVEAFINTVRNTHKGV